MEFVRNGLEVARTNRLALLTSGISLAWIFSMLLVTRCRFMTNKEEDFGLFSHPFIDEAGENLGCIRYSKEALIDSGLKTGRAFSILTFIFTTAAWAATVYVVLWNDKRAIIWKMAHCSFASAAFSQMLVFAALSSNICSESGCVLARAGVLSIYNTILLDILCLAWFFVPVPSKTWITWWECERARDNDESTEIRRTVPGGTPGEAGSIASGDTQDSPQAPQLATNIQDIPHFRLTKVGLFGIMWAVSLFGIKRCSFLSMGFDEYGISSIAGLGLFSQALYSEGDFLGCIDFASSSVDEFDASFRAARVFGALTVVLTTSVCLVSLLLLVHEKLLPQCWFALRVMLPSVTCTQLVTLAALDSNVCSVEGENECRIGGTGVIVLLNIVFTAMLSTLVLSLPTPRRIVFVVNLECSKNEEVTKDARVTPDPQAETRVTREAPAGIGRSIQPSNRTTHQQRPSTNLARVIPPNRMNSNQRSAVNSKIGAYRVIPEHRLLEQSSNVSNIVITVDYTRTEKKTIKEVTFADGSKTVTTTIEEIDTDDASFVPDENT